MAASFTRLQTVGVRQREMSEQIDPKQTERRRVLLRAWLRKTCEKQNTDAAATCLYSCLPRRERSEEHFKMFPGNQTGLCKRRIEWRRFLQKLFPASHKHGARLWLRNFLDAWRDCASAGTESFFAQLVMKSTPQFGQLKDVIIGYKKYQTKFFLEKSLLIGWKLYVRN